MLAQGFAASTIAGLVDTGLVTSTTERVSADGRTLEVIRLRITGRGRAARARWRSTAARQCRTLSGNAPAARRWQARRAHWRPAPRPDRRAPESSARYAACQHFADRQAPFGENVLEELVIADLTAVAGSVGGIGPGARVPPSGFALADVIVELRRDEARLAQS